MQQNKGNEHEMTADRFLVNSISDAVTQELFGKAIGKTKQGVADMVNDRKVPFVEMKNPDAPNARAERYIYLPAWNAGVKLAFESRPKEIRDGWLLWLGLTI